MTAMEAMEYSIKILAILTLVQSVEYIKLFYRKNIELLWSWEIVSCELFGNQKILNFIFGLFLKKNNFLVLNFVRAILGVWSFFLPTPELLFLLGFLHFVTMLRWFGNYNGGSDYMYMFLVLICGVGLISEHSASVCVWIISVQLILSYVRAGYVKIRSKKWWSGEALIYFMSSQFYEKTNLVEILSKKNHIAKLLSWGVIFFEILFPVSLLSFNSAILFMGLAFFFHASVVYYFGLNRFLWAWLAAYPGLIFVAS